jgi:glycosyltransferase involved in cell wall biosynthesis
VRIAYLTTYQGPSLLKRRPIIRNRSLSNAVKIELVASLLRANSHDVEIISQGEVVDNKLTFYPGFSEPQRFDSEIPVHYSSVLPIRRLNGLWSSQRMLQLFRARHRAAPFDLVIIFNLKEQQVTCANYALRRLHVPVILEYEDDRFVDVVGKTESGWLSQYRARSCKNLIAAVSGCIGVSPHLLSQLPNRVPRMLLRGVVGDDLVQASKRSIGAKLNRILFSGTHIESNGVARLIAAWRSAPIDGWELHITGYGELTNMLRQMAENVPGVVFHGLISRQELINLMTSAKICINPHAVSQTPGNVFAFKIIEYLAAGAHCITTPMGRLELELEAGITYMPDNSPETISATLNRVIEEHLYERLAAQSAHEAYGTRAVSRSLDDFLKQVPTRNGKEMACATST